MKTLPPLTAIGLLGALGLLGASAALAAPGVDTSQWKCSACPAVETGSSGSVELGLGTVSERSAKFGDFNGLNRQGGYLVAGGELRYRNDEGYYGKVDASDLGLRSRNLAAESGREGVYTLKLGYSEIQHSVASGVSTPMLGAGTTSQSLPAGYPAATTAAMPLDSTLHDANLGIRRSRYDLGASFAGAERWTYRVNLRHEVREGTQRLAGSFFSSSTQLVAPVDQVTDQFELSTSWTGQQGQATLAYQASIFRNAADSLTWANPYTTGVAGATSGQLALAPDNQFHQVLGSASYQLSPTVRASGDLALGRMTQDAPYLASTLNTTLLVPALPASSLRGRVDTLNASVRLSATPAEAVRLQASASRDQRDNKTPADAYTQVSTDMFLGLPRTSQPYSTTTDRLRLSGDYRAGKTLRGALGIDQDKRERTLQDVRSTRESTVWTRLGAQVMDGVGLGLKLAHAERSASDYTPSDSVDPADNPLLRKYNLAQRRRDSAGLRTDLAVGEGVNLGLDLAGSRDTYQRSTIGLLNGRSVNVGADVSAALTEQTQLHVFAQAERIRSRQAGSQAFAQADWWSDNRDDVDVFGTGVTHSLLKGKLVLGADLALTRSRSDITVDTGTAPPAFPTATSTLDSLKLHATYRLQDKLTLRGSFWHEAYDAQDWRYDGVLPATMANVLVLGEQAPHYRVNVLSLALRYSF
jgi:MtrB/PioB family decaheme-associated outer membrane protein